MDVADDVDGPLDPRIQIELENLNSATDDINKLEIELDEANTAFKQLLSESTNQLKDIMNKIGSSCIEKARCYYEAMEVARQAQVQCQHQAHLFRRASEIHAAAKETVALAEARFIAHRHEWNFDQAWQEMLNHATIKVTDAENQKAECGREHHRRAMLFHDAEKKAQQLEEKHRRAIIKARPYFDVRADCRQKMATLKERIECRQKSVKEAKRAYSKSLRTLEDISNQIHQSRRDYDIMVNGPREPGVGAELISPERSLNYEEELNKFTLSRTNSVATSEPDSEDRDQDFKDVIELKQRMENLGGRSVDGSESTSSQWELELQASVEKLNTLSLKKSDWNIKNNSTPNTSDLNQCPTNPSSQINLDSDKSKKLPMDFQILKKINSTPTNNNQGWQSLTQSPINSILNRSKIAIKNSLSKSLTSSPVNLGFTFGRARDNSLTNDSPKAVSSNSNSHQDTIGVPTNSFSSSIVNSNAVLSFNDNQNDNNQGDGVPRESGTTFASSSANASPIKSKSVGQCGYDTNFIDAPIFKEPSCKISSVKELPLLSMFEEHSNLQTSKDKSCSMINLADKRNLKSLLDNLELGNIQAVSVERLANARHILMAQHDDSKVEANKSH